MTTKYTNFYNVYNDTSLYTIIRDGGDLSLDAFPSIASNRWTWIVQNWADLRTNFIAIADGDEELLARISDLNNEVVSYNLGNRNNPFDNSDKFQYFLPLLSEISLSQLSLNFDENILKNKEIERIQNLEIEDFQNMLAFLKKFIAIQCQEIGLGDPDAAALLGISVAPKRKTATVKDLEIIDNYESLRILIEDIVFQLMNSVKKPPNLLAGVGNDLGSGSSVNIVTSYVSYSAQPYEVSLEHMAFKYLGSFDRWYELVTINNLQHPFTDEAGIKFPLLAPAAVNNLIISTDAKEYVKIGSKISIGSHKFVEESRFVEKIIENDNGTMILFLSGSQDLNRFAPKEEAFIRAYRPHTVKKGDFLKIPSNDAGDRGSSLQTPTSDSLRRLDKDLLNFGIDIARDENSGDLIVDANGNFKLSYGIENIKQTVRSVIKTVRGELPFHPTYGIDDSIGSKFYGTLDEAAAFSQILIGTLLKDPRFQEVKIHKLQATANSMALSLLIKITGVSEFITLEYIS